jgi:hypothetical protein
MTPARRIEADDELARLAAAGEGFVIDPFNRRWHRANCPRVKAMTTKEPKWFADQEEPRDAYLEARMAQYPTAQRIVACRTCSTGAPSVSPKPAAAADPSDLTIIPSDRGFVARSSHRVTFGPRPGSAAHAVQAELRRQLAKLRPGEGQTLHAIFRGGIPANSDVENQLIYNVFDGGSGPALARGVRFELDDADPVTTVEYHYSIAPVNERFAHWSEERPATEWQGVRIAAGTSERLLARTWWALRATAPQATVKLTERERFGVRIHLEVPLSDHGRLTAERLKQLLDGVVSALQRQTAGDEVVARIAGQLGLEPSEVAAQLTDESVGTLGDAERAIALTAQGVQWHPDDSRLVAGEITIRLADVSTWQLSGSVFAVSPRA